MSLNTELSDLFATMSALMELRGENVFKVIAFQKVSRIIKESSLDLKKSIADGTLGDIEGIGKGSQQIIEEYVKTGKSSVYEEVAASVPKGLVDLMQIEGLGPKTIHMLWQERGITSLDLLTKAIDSGELAGLKGIGQKKIDTIKAGIALLKSRTGADGTVKLRVGIADADEVAAPLLEQVKKLKGVVRAQLAGSLRRRRETIADIDIVASLKDSAQGEAIGQAFTKLEGVAQTVVAGASKTSVKLSNGMQADLRLVPDENFGAALLYFTGSKEHNVKIRGLALKHKMTLNEWGLYNLADYEKAKKEVAKPPELASSGPTLNTSDWVRTRGVKKKLYDLLRQPACHSVPGSLPVLFFGDPSAASVASVGLNPSLWEYLHEKTKEELSGDARRFETLGSLEAVSRERLTDEQCQRAIERMRRYFEPGKPVYEWFKPLNRVANGMGLDYAARQVLHLDLVLEATDPAWSKLEKASPEEFAALRERDLDALRWELENIPLSIVLCDGTTSREVVTRLLAGKPLASGKLKRIKWVIAKGVIGDREILIAGWDIPLNRATGLREQEQVEFGKLLAEQIQGIRPDVLREARKRGANPVHVLPPVAARTEEEIYNALGLDYIEPELREDRGEVDFAAAKKLPNLITRKDIRGDLHTHTTASDGQNTIEQMAEAAKALGYEYLAITDHSKAMAMANGLSAERLLKHIEAIHKASDKIKGITLLAGTECDILVDGRLDYDDDVLKELDIVVASPHISLKQDEKKATDRLLRAIDNKYVNIIGHPTGRLINGRLGLPLDLPKVYAAAAANGTALEINAGYPRLDLNDVNARAAVAAGCTIAIDTDTHTTVFEEIELGIAVARRAGLEAKNVLNCMTLAGVRKFVKAKRDR